MKLSTEKTEFKAEKEVVALEIDEKDLGFAAVRGKTFLLAEEQISKATG